MKSQRDNDYCDFRYHAPSRNIFVLPLQMIYWLLFLPSSWEHYLQELQLDLAPDFSLFDLNREKLKNPPLRKLLIGVFFVLPVEVLLAVFLYHLSRGEWGNPYFGHALLASLGYFLSTIWLMSSGLGVGAGVIFGTALGITIGFLDKSASNIYFAYSLSAGLTGAVMLNLIPARAKRPIHKEIISFYSALLVIFGFLLLIYLIVSGKLQGLDNSGLFLKIPQSFSSLFPMLLSGVIIFGVVISIILLLRATISRRYQTVIRRAAIMGFSYAFVFIISYFIMLKNATYNPESYIFSGLGGGIFMSTIFIIPLALAGRGHNSDLAVVTSALVTGTGWIGFGSFIILGFEFNPLKSIFAFCITLLGLTVRYWLPVLLYPALQLWNNGLLRLEKRPEEDDPALFRLHLVYWVENQPRRWNHLDEHLILLSEKYKIDCQPIFRWLLNTNQAWAVKSALLEISLQRLVECRTIADISWVSQKITSGEFEGTHSAIIYNLYTVSKDTQAALNQISSFHTRSTLGLIRNRLISLERELMISNDIKRNDFLDIITHWLMIFDLELDRLAVTAQASRQIQNPYICGIPLNDKQEVFVGREDIILQIEQILANPQRPPLLVFGQRRMGKTSLLLNLGRITQSNIVPFFFDAQGLAGLNDLPELFYRLTQQARRPVNQNRGIRFPAMDLSEFQKSPFLALNDWMDHVEDQLSARKVIGLWTVDEFEVLYDWLLQHSDIAADFLNQIRSFLQHRTRLKLLLAVSHTFDELMPLSSFMINVQVVKIGYLTEREVNQLVESPIRNFELSYEPETLQQIYQLTHGHPHLVQLLCYELVNYKNEQNQNIRLNVTSDEIEQAAQRALVSGGFFFGDIAYQQVQPKGREALCYLASRSTPEHPLPEEDWRRACPENFEQHLATFLRRDLVENTPAGYRFQVEMVRRWINQTQSC